MRAGPGVVSTRTQQGPLDSAPGRRLDVTRWADVTSHALCCGGRASGFGSVEVRLYIPVTACPEYGLRRLHLLQECAVFPQCGVHGEWV